MPDDQGIWVRLLINGSDTIHAPQCIVPVPPNVSVFQQKVKQIFAPRLDYCFGGDLAIYKNTDLDNEEAPLAGDKAVPQEGNSFANPLQVFAPAPTDAEKGVEKGRPTKRLKLRHEHEKYEQDPKLEQDKWIDLKVNRFKIMTPTDSDVVRYYAREGMAELFQTLSDSKEDVADFNIEFIGAPGTGKTSLAWSVAEHLGFSKTEVVWAGRRYRSEGWEVVQFQGGEVYGFEDLPDTLSSILKLKDLKDTEVLIVDAPIDLSDESQKYNGPAAYSWASKTAVHGGRRGLRRVIHVSSLGAATQKAEEKRQINVKEIVMRPWTRQDFIASLKDTQLKRQVCDTLDLADASSVTEEELVDRKFFFSGINARWFFNYGIDDIKKECVDIRNRMSSSTVNTGDRHKDAVNSALQRYPVDGRQVVLFTSSYLALSIGNDSNEHKQFLVNYPLIKDYLGNGAPGEIFEADFAINLQHFHDLAAAQRSIMGEHAQTTHVPMGATTEDKTVLLWPTGKLYRLPTASNRELTNQTLPKEAVKNKESQPCVAQWFIPENNSQPFLDFFVLVPMEEEEEKKWELRIIQNTVATSHSADLEQLKLLVGGILDSGYDLHDKITAAYIIEDKGKQGKVGMKDSGCITVSRSTGTRSRGREDAKYTVVPVHVVYARTGSVPL